MEQFNALNARQYISNLQSRPKLKAIPTPFWPELDGHISIGKIKADEGFDMTASIGDNKQFSASLLAKCLVLTDTQEPLFDEKGLSLILQEDLDEIKDLFKLCAAYNGLGADEEDTKKNLPTIQGGDSSSNLPASTDAQ